MKKVLVSLLVAAVLASSQGLDYKTDKAWLKFKKDFSYSFPSALEESRRYQIFSTNVDRINQANLRKVPYKLGINEFTLMTAEEFKAAYMTTLETPTGVGCEPTHRARSALKMPLLAPFQTNLTGEREKLSLL